MKKLFPKDKGLTKKLSGKMFKYYRKLSKYEGYQQHKIFFPQMHYYILEILIISASKSHKHEWDVNKSAVGILTLYNFQTCVITFINSVIFRFNVLTIIQWKFIYLLIMPILGISTFFLCNILNVINFLIP